MAIGSFEGLYTFLDVAEIYEVSDSCLRKQVARGKFVIGEDIKKIGRTWIITEQAMVKKFGTLKFEEFKKKQDSKDKPQIKKINCGKVKVKKSKISKQLESINENEDIVNDGWSNESIKGLELRSFAFNTNDSE